MSDATSPLNAVKQEICQALGDLVHDGTHNIIDLHSAPLSAADYEQLETFLGNGEIDVFLNVLGKTRVCETSYAGVWRLEHFDADDQRVGYFIEVGHVPEILRSQCDDIEEGWSTMRAILEMEEDV